MSEVRIDRLSSGNYMIWKTVMMSTLQSKELWDYVVEKKAADDQERLSNEKAKAIIYSAMESNQIAATGVCDTAHDLWVKIKENHEGAISNLRSIALMEFMNLKLRKNESIVSFAGRFENALGKLKSSGHEVDDKTQLYVFSNTLPQHMKTTVNMFTMAKPDGKVNELISQLKIQHHLDLTDDTRQAAAYNVNETRQPANKPHRNPMSNITCSYCKKLGHMWRECRKLKTDNERKKRFGQMNQSGQANRSHDQNKSADQPQQSKFSNNQRRDQPRQLNQQPKQQSAFNASKHNFSQGKFSWIVDSGASSHMTPYKDQLVSYVEYDAPRRIYLGDNTSIEVYGSGDLPFTSQDFTGELKEVLWVPELSENLFSVGRAMERGCRVEFCNQKSTVYFYREDEVVLCGYKRRDSIYFLLYLEPQRAQQIRNARAQQFRDERALVGASLHEWHKRLGHCSIETVKALMQSNAVTGMTIANNDTHECHACTMGKLCRAHHPQRERIMANESQAVLHLDTVKMPTVSIGGAMHFVLATEEYSGYKLFETVSSKALVPDVVKRLITEAELQSGRPVKAIMTDNGTEYDNRSLDRWISRKGIIHFYSTAYTPQQNGRAERANRHVLDGVRTLLSDSGLTEDLWGEALNTVVYTTNRIPGKKQAKTRYELFTGNKPDISNLRVFGQKAIVRESDCSREGKLAPRGEQMVFVGYTDRHNTYRFYLTDPVPRIIISCDAKFISATKESGPQQSPPAEPATLPADDDETEIEDNGDDNMSDAEGYSTSQEDNDDDDGDSDDHNRTDATIVAQPSLAIGSRTTRSQVKSGAKPAPPPILIGKPTPTRQGALFTLDNEPRTIKDAQESEDWPKWKQAMDEEIHALAKNKTWDLVDRPTNVKPIKNKWVYKAKLKPDGTIDRYKARLVAKGFTQIPNVDYKETYAPVASMTTIRMFLAIANQCMMHIVQFDVKTAFLHGDLDETLYMEQPEHYNSDSNKVCKLVKSLYGLKQAPRQWNKKFDSFLKLFKLTQSEVDRCLYYSHDKSILLAIYVDDGLAAGRDRTKLNELIKYLMVNFELKVMDCESYLGFEITRNFKERSLSICQANYVDKILKRFGMEDCKPVSTPEEVGGKLDESPLLPADNQFKELVGSLLYLTTCSRPDIAHAVSMASRTAQPTQAHWVALKRILRYLKGTRDQGIRFRWENPNQLVGYSDADYANDPETRKSTTGYCIYFGGGPIAWRCQRQPIITLSTTEAEYVAGCELVKEILPIRQQLIELGQIDDRKPVTIYIDNQSTVKIASSEGGQNRTKHIDIREKWLTEQSLNGKIQVQHISGDEQAADILTKPLYKSKFIANRSKLLTQVAAFVAIMALCSTVSARTLTLTDPVTTSPSQFACISGDTRSKTTEIFVNYCDSMFNYTSAATETEFLLKGCYDYYMRKHYGQLTHCKQLPTVGPSLEFTPIIFSCLDNSDTDRKSDSPSIGKCDITRKSSQTHQVPERELSAMQAAWNKHKKKVEELHVLKREKRVVPLALAGFAVLSLILGPGRQTYYTSKLNAENIEKISNVTDQHSILIRESTLFFDEYKKSVETLHEWADDVEERLGDDPRMSWLNNDPIYRGKKSTRIKTYMQWYDAQEKLLTELNLAAGRKKIPPRFKTMLNGTDNFEQVANMSTMIDCSYRLEDKNLVTELDFIYPTIDNEVEILKVSAQDIYTFKNVTDDSDERVCWTSYQGPTHVIHNKTNGCIKGISTNRLNTQGVRGLACLEPVNELYQPNSSGANWFEESCSREAPALVERIQITEIDGAHKIYCYPFDIVIEGEQQRCPKTSFILEGHANYKIGGIRHHGAYIDTTISRRIRSTSDRSPEQRLLRHKRSPMAPPSQGPHFLSSGNHHMTTTKAPAAEITTAAPEHKSRTYAEISRALTNMTNNMNISLTKIKETLKILPERLNITKASFDSLLDKPFEMLSESYTQMSSYIKSLGSMMGVVTVCFMIVLIMPAIEMIILGLRIAKIPAGLWIGSFKRVTTKLRATFRGSKDLLPTSLRPKRKRWDDCIKTA